MRRAILCSLAAMLWVAGPLLAADTQSGAPPLPNAQMQAVLDATAKLGGKPIESLPPTLARLQPSAADGVIQLIQDRGTVAPDKLPAVGKVSLISMPGPDGISLVARVYAPKGEGPFPVIVYYHGGGWVIADLDTYDASCRGLCDMNKALVFAVEYRKAPEHKFPAATEDAYAWLQWVFGNAKSFGGDPTRVAVVGESAGGNLATVSCLMAKERGGQMPVAQVLVYPVTNYGFDTPSYKINANAKPLNAAMMHWFFNYYLNSPADGQNIHVSPLRASAEQLKGLPPATVVTAEVDPLCSEGLMYADKLKSAGVDVSTREFNGVTHEFFGMAAVVDQAKSANSFVAERLKTAFNR